VESAWHTFGIKTFAMGVGVPKGINQNPVQIVSLKIVNFWKRQIRNSVMNARNFHVPD
jgi:hypothetical protein